MRLIWIRLRVLVIFSAYFRRDITAVTLLRLFVTRPAPIFSILRLIWLRLGVLLILSAYFRRDINAGTLLRLFDTKQAPIFCFLRRKNGAYWKKWRLSGRNGA